MRKQFSIRTEPHVAEIGDTELLFQPEIAGAEFLDAYEVVIEAQKRLNIDPAKPETVEPAALRELTVVVREFLAKLMLPESAETFADMSLPDRILREILDWAMEVYGERPPTSSSVSSTPSPPAGRSGTGASRSRASTRASGR